MQEKFMKIAIEVAKQSGEDIPVGAVLVYENQIIAIAHNQKEKNNDVTAHAEILVIKKGEELLNNWRLNDCELYVTLEPCPMCSWAILQSGIKAVYFGSYDLMYGSLESKLNLKELSNSKIVIKGGIFEKECDEILKNYFRELRK